MLIFFYRILSNLLLIPIFLFFLTRFLLGKETLKSILQKFTIYKSSKLNVSNKKVVWVNAVSIGEAKVGMLVAELLKEKYKTLHGDTIEGEFIEILQSYIVEKYG